MRPRGELASIRYCLAAPGKEYLVYLPEGGGGCSAPAELDRRLLLSLPESEWALIAGRLMGPLPVVPADPLPDLGPCLVETAEVVLPGALLFQ
jgi:hypothetical protein